MSRQTELTKNESQFLGNASQRPAVAPACDVYESLVYWIPFFTVRSRSRQLLPACVNTRVTRCVSAAQGSAR